jgi:hypothetical protein
LRPEIDYFRVKSRSDLRRGTGRGMKNKGVYIVEAFFNLEDFKKCGQGEMEKMDLAGGLRRFQQIAGRALIAFNGTFFCMKEVNRRNDQNKEKEDDQMENLLLSADHFI